MALASLTLNWVDLLMLMIVLYGVMQGQNSDIITELFQLFGVIMATYSALFFYKSLSGPLYEAVPFPEESWIWTGTFHEWLAYCLIAGIIIIAFHLMKDGWRIILQLNIPSDVDKAGGLAIAILKTYFYCGLVFTLLALTGHGPIGTSAQESYTSQLFRNTMEQIYQRLPEPDSLKNSEAAPVTT